MTTPNPESDSASGEKMTQIAEQLATFNKIDKQILSSGDLGVRDRLMQRQSNEKMAIFDAMLEMTEEDVQFPLDHDTIYSLIRFFKNGGPIWEDHNKIDRAKQHLNRLLRNILKVNYWAEKFDTGLAAQNGELIFTTAVEQHGDTRTLHALRVTRDNVQKATEISWKSK